MKKYVYLFKEADGHNKNLFGGKGANLAEMTKIGLPVPQGFTVTTEACTKYYEDCRTMPDDAGRYHECCRDIASTVIAAG